MVGTQATIRVTVGITAPLNTVCGRIYIDDWLGKYEPATYSEISFM